jgi:ABC-type glycerol-3-phosphate transport system substrate-binding protein
MSREFFLQQMVLGQMSSFVNWETGEVSLDSEEFTDMLEFSNYFPGQEEESDSVDMVKAVKKGNLMAASLHLSGVYDIEVLTQLYKNAGGFQITGYPSGDSDNTVSIDFGNPAMAITEQCEDKEGAWEFLRYFLTKEKQVSYALGIMGGMLNGLPVRKDAFEKALEYAMATESYTDENGMEINPIASNYLYEECELSIGPVSEEEAEQVRDIVDRIGAVSMENDVVSGQITDIIQEEAEAFYAGDKTAAEVAEIVQSRVKLFVSENS